jgi:ABC-2 type transport system permease protein
VRLETRVQPAAAESAENPFDRFSPGMLVQFVLFGLTQSATALVLERRSGTWDRLLMTPLTRGGLVLGKLLSLLGLVLAQALILIVAGQFLFGVDYMRAPLATLLLAVALSVWVAALGVLIGVLARNEGQALAVAMMAMFAFSALGGAWFPLEVAGETFAAVARLLPAAWAMDGFQDILLRGGGLADVVPAVGVVMGYAVLCLGVAVWRLRRA